MDLKGINRAVFHGEVADAAAFSKVPGIKTVPGSGTKLFTVNLPFIDSDMLKEWDSHGLQYSFEQEKMNWGDILINCLPWLLMFYSGCS